MNEWEGIPKNITPYIGFIYIIKNKVNDKYYIGQKTFFKYIDRVKDKVLTKDMCLKREKLQIRLEQGHFKTKKAYNEEITILKKKEKEHFSARKYKTKKVKKETDWRNYFSSSDFLKEDIKINPNDYSRRILVCCETKGMLNYAETFLQMKYGVVFDDNSYNGLVNIRANTKMFQNYQKECRIMLDKINKNQNITT